MPDEWSEKQLTPLSMFELARHWIDGLKIIGAGNGAGLLAAGAALNTFSTHQNLIPWIKAAAIVYFGGVFAFAFGLWFIHVAVFEFDEMAHSSRKQDRKGLENHSKRTTSNMNLANTMANVGMLTFLIGTAIGFIIMVKY